MSLVPIRINVPSPAVAPGREVVAFAHRARRADPAAPRRAALILNPFGQEAVRTHRLLRVAADRLARQGIDVLRFDYYGSGDSPGTDLQADLRGWVADTLAAHQMLAEFSGAEQITWLGIRLGASVALLAAGDDALAASRPPARLVLWNPVLDGKAHLQALAADHRRALQTTYSVPREPARLIRAFDTQWPPTELLGMAVAPAMAAQIEALSGEALAVAVPRIELLTQEAGRCQASAASAAADPRHESAWRQACIARGVSFGEQRITSEFDWTSEEALNTALVPADAINAVLNAVTAEIT